MQTILKVLKFIILTFLSRLNQLLYKEPILSRLIPLPNPNILAYVYGRIPPDESFLSSVSPSIWKYFVIYACILSLSI